MIKVKEFKSMGRGLVTTKAIKKGRVIFYAEVITLSKPDTKLIDQTILGSYNYDLGRGKTAIALGFGSLFNHNESENVTYTIVQKNGRTMIQYKAVRSIKPGEQLFINYGYNP